MNPHGISTTSPSNWRVCRSTTRALGETIVRPRRPYGLPSGESGFPLGAAGAGAAGLLLGGTAGLPAAGRGTIGTIGLYGTVTGAEARPSKMLPVTRWVEAHAR